MKIGDLMGKGWGSWEAEKKKAGKEKDTRSKWEKEAEKAVQAMKIVHAVQAERAREELVLTKEEEKLKEGLIRSFVTDSISYRGGRTTPAELVQITLPKVDDMLAFFKTDRARAARIIEEEAKRQLERKK